VRVCTYTGKEGGGEGRKERGKEGGREGMREGKREGGKGGGERDRERRARTCKRRAGILLRNHAQVAPQEPFPGIAALYASTNTRCEISPLLAPPELDRARQIHLTDQ
jgi:hypothetical protein